MLAKMKKLKLKILTVTIAGVSVAMIISGIPSLQTIGGWLFAAATLASLYLIRKEARAKGKEIFL